MSDELSTRTRAALEEVGLLLESVLGRIDELTARVDALTAELTAPSAPPSSPPPAAPTPAPVPDPEDAPRVLAVELAVGGATRADVDARLRERFGVTSTTDLLDDVFGEGTPAGARLPWSGRST